jgi:hypothetical protein
MRSFPPSAFAEVVRAADLWSGRTVLLHQDPVGAADLPQVRVWVGEDASVCGDLVVFVVAVVAGVVAGTPRLVPGG